jgi:GNAT superfamily N-acetyltransferase
MSLPVGNPHDSPPVVIRQAVESDAALIYSSWLRSYWNATARDLGIEFSVYQAGQRARIARLLARYGARVACSPEAPDTIMGWSCDDGFTLHYLYVRQIYRRQGIAGQLRGCLLAATHMTPAFKLAFPYVVYQPYFLEQT